MAMSAVYTNFCGMIVSETRSGVERDYVPDTLGSTAALVDNTEAVTDRWEYWPYGEVSQRTGTSATPFTYVGMLGYFKDVLDKLTYIRARFLKPNLGRWLTVDPWWPLLTAFRYARSRPTYYRDYTGQHPTRGLPGDNPQFWPPRLAPDYGHYCGLETVCASGDGPIDCIDSFCQTHDDCLNAAPAFGLGAAKCNCDLAIAAFAALQTGCCGSSPNPLGCMVTAKAIYETFGPLCTITGIIGGIGDLGRGIGGVIEDVEEGIEGLLDGLNQIPNGIRDWYGAPRP